MVMQSGDVPAGGEDSKSAKPLPWKYIALAAIVAAAILVIFFAATTGIFSSPASVADTTTSSVSTGSGFSPPAENSGSLAITDEKDEKPTKATRIPSPNEIMPTGTLISISNPQKFVKANSNLVITEIEIDKSNNKIEASYLNTDLEKSTIIRPAIIIFFDEKKKEIWREQWCCQRYRDYRSTEYKEKIEYEYGKALAHCQWPEDFCYTVEDKPWKEYWKKKIGKELQPQKVGGTKYESIIPTIEPGKKYSFTTNTEIPQNTKYVKIT